MKQGLIAELESANKFFNKTIECFEEGDSDFAPDPELYSVASHVQHAADTIEWFIEGAFGEGWNMEFEEHVVASKDQKSLKKARQNLDEAFKHVIATIKKASEKELLEPIPDKSIMEGAPRLAIVTGIVDHTAHHRGSLAVYARLIGKVPAMPYG
jgi:uncharacterized damage-inducible protein DinB